MDRESFLREYNIDEATFESARTSWEELEKIYRNYQAIEPKLRSPGKEFVDRYFYDVEKAGIHLLPLPGQGPGASVRENHPQAE